MREVIVVDERTSDLRSATAPGVHSLSAAVHGTPFE